MSKVRTLDLKTISYEERVLEFLSNLVSKFYTEESGTSISEMGVTFNGTTGMLELSFETREHAEKYISKHPADAQSDAAGKFNGHPPDYIFDFYKDFHQFEEWRSWYEGEEDETTTELELVDLGETLHKFSSPENLTINEVALKILVPVVKKFTTTEVFMNLPKDRPFRVGVDTWPDGAAQFWLFENA